MCVCMSVAAPLLCLSACNVIDRSGVSADENTTTIVMAMPIELCAVCNDVCMLDCGDIQRGVTSVEFG